MEVEKEVLREGGGPRPEPSARVQLRYAVHAMDGSCLQSVGADECPFSVPLGDGALTPELEAAVREMQVGERCRLRGPLRLLGVPPAPLQAPGNTVVVELELVGLGLPLGPGGVHATATTLEKRVAAWLADAVDDRQSGNALLKEGKLLAAKQCYCSSISRCVKLLRRPAGSAADIADCLRSSRCNLALCYLKLGRFRQCCRQCDKVLAQQPDNVKALYRRAQAYGEQQEYSSALRDVEACLALDGGNADASKLQAKLLKALRQREAQERERYRGLFGT